jgi:cellulose synthase (UDP-forming)
VTGTAGSAGRHRNAALILPAAPTDAEKWSYSFRGLPYLAAAIVISALFVTLAQVLFEARNPAVLPFGVYTFTYLFYQLISVPVNFGGRSFDAAEHYRFVRSWQPGQYPRVDIFLPICGEAADILRNTWTGVNEMIDAYPGRAYAWVLDDGPSDEARALATELQVGYIRRARSRDHKKSGNLNHAFAQTDGEFIAIFDADFRPRADFLAETLPYMDDPDLGIVQTPQFFRVLREQPWIERAAGVVLEVFYRSVQVSRDRFGSALCVGSNAVYRRAALMPVGGFTVIPYAEDSHTGLDMRLHGWQLKYIPVVLAAGICPATIDGFTRQQYRWCNGATSLLFTKRVWHVPMSLDARLPYLAGWLWNLTTAMRTLILPLIPVTLLAFYPGEIRLKNVLLLVPALITGLILYPLWHNARWSLGVWPLALAVGWAQVLALWDYPRHKVMSWQPTRGPGDATRRFRSAVITWNGGFAAIWVALAAWRIVTTDSPQYAIVAMFGLLYAIIVARVIFPGRGAW